MSRAMSPHPGGIVSGILALTLLSATTARACDPTHHWNPVRARAWRQPSPALLRDVVRVVLAQLRDEDPTLTILPVEDRYAMHCGPYADDEVPQPLTPWQRRARELDTTVELEESLVAAGLRVIPYERVRDFFADREELAWYDPMVLRELAEEVDADRFVRASLVGYSSSVVLEEDLYPSNRGLFRESTLERVEVRIVLQDGQGELLYIDEVHATQTRREVFWEDPARGGRYTVELVELPFFGDGVIFHEGEIELPHVSRTSVLQTGGD